MNVLKIYDDLKTADTEYLKKVAKEIQLNGAAIAYDQKFTESELISLIKRFGECEAPNLFMNPKEYPELFLVTGKKDDHGNKIGMFGDTELGWHSNGNSRHQIDKILITLYCVEEDINTTLSICHTSDPFYEMSDDEQEYWKSIKIRIQFINNTMYHLDDDDPELEFMSKNKGSIRNLVGVHPHTGKYYFYFPYHFIVKAWEGKKEIDAVEMVERLKPKIFRSRHQHHHIFKKGDLLLMDQFSSLHRRTPVLDKNRLLWRVASDYKHIEAS
jgi:alpha-ketoglutarate-dependent taurine dioxygenase